MELIPIFWGGIIASYILLALIHLIILIVYRGERSQIFFIFGATFAVLMAFVELKAITMTYDVGTITQLLRIGQIAVSGMMISTTLFLHYNLECGRKWLVWLTVCTRLVVVLIALILSQPFNYETVQTIYRVPFLDGSFPVPVGIKSPRTLMGSVSCLLFVWCSFDFLFEIWKRRKHAQRGITLSLSVCVFSLLILNFQLFGVISLFRSSPINFFTLPIFSVYYLGVALAITFEIGRRVIEAGQLSRKLEENERSLKLVVSAVGLEVYTFNVQKNELSLSPHILSALGFDPGQPVPLTSFMERVEPEDREQLGQAIKRTIDASVSPTVEFRIRYADGLLRWITVIGEANTASHGMPHLLNGVYFDNTQRKLAEEAAHNLNGMLINAQEKERTRLARELHDHLGQRIALHAIELGLIGDNPPPDREQFRMKIQSINERVSAISQDISTLSHTLHPANLRRLGLVAAMRGLCRDISMSHEIAIDFRPDPLIGSLPIPDDTSLSLFRITQESLNNVIKHSQATQVEISISRNEDRLELEIRDDGVGFRMDEVSWNRSLGLTSMRERARLVNGTFSIHTSSGAGTIIKCSAPVHFATSDVPEK